MTKDHGYLVAHRTSALVRSSNEAFLRVLDPKKSRGNTDHSFLTHVVLGCHMPNGTTALREDDIFKAFVELANARSATQSEASISSVPGVRVPKLERSNSKPF